MSTLPITRCKVTHQRTQSCPMEGLADAMEDLDTNSKLDKFSRKKRPQDPVIGLDVGGRVYYCHQSTLTNATGSYFSGRFRQDSMLSPGDETKDERGRSVYFIDRNGRLFEHILEYLRTNELPSELPTFQEDPKLWRGLRVEADFFGLERLSALLQVTYSCSPDLHGARGVLYWLGTDKGLNKEYKNPYSIGAIHVGGWVDDPIDDPEALEYVRLRYFLARAPPSRAAFVQYRPMTATKELVPNPTSNLLLCQSARKGRPAVVDLKSVYLRPTHYSLRIGDCVGMKGPWNFEASVDGKSWDCLHAARNDRNLLKLSREEKASLVTIIANEGMGDDKKTEFLTDYAEEHYRHIWKLDPAPTQFYQFVRIVGVPEDVEDGDERQSCLHGEGLELYGDVYEE